MPPPLTHLLALFLLASFWVVVILLRHPPLPPHPRIPESVASFLCPCWACPVFWLPLVGVLFRHSPLPPSRIPESQASFWFPCWASFSFLLPLVGVLLRQPPLPPHRRNPGSEASF